VANDDALRIEFLSPTETAEGLARISALADLVNAVYKDAEKGLWLDDAQRTTPQEIHTLVRAGEIAAAQSNGRIVGCVRIRRLDDRLGEFGMLVTSPQRRRLGIGRRLVQFAEEHCRQAGLGTLQLELLVPRDWTHPFKELLAQWYARLGYRRVGLGAMEKSYPDLTPHLATACDFVIYHKALQPRAADSE
jgi:ribosomal protein S18 acetylase RimI-like enzyme